MVVGASIQRGSAHLGLSAHRSGIFWAGEPSETLHVWAAHGDMHPESVHHFGDVEIRPLHQYLANPTNDLQQRLDNANRHFRRKTAEVFGDEDAVRLLARLYQAVVIDIVDFDSCKDGIPLAKLTAANFAEIGANVIYITEAGQNFIDSIHASV